MRNLTTELKVGLLILGGLVLIVYSSVIVTGWRPGQFDTYTVYVHMDNVAGLLVGSPAQVSGIKIGEVRAIELIEGQARIALAIYTRHPIYADASATIKSLGILGDKYVDIDPGSPSQTALKDGDTVRFVIPGSDLDSLVDTAAVILRDVQTVTGTLRETLGGEPGKDRLNTLLNELVASSQNLNRFTITLERVMRENEGALGHTAKNLEQLTAGLRRVVESNEGGLQSIVARLDRFSGNIERISADNERGIRETIDSLAGFSKELEAITVQNRKQLDEIVAQLGTFSESLASDGPQITANVRAILEENRTGLKSSVASLDGALANLNELSRDLRDLTRDNREDFTRIVSNLETLTGDLANRGPSITANLDGILEENRTPLHSSVANLDRSLGKLDATMTNLNEVTGKIERGEGSLGKLVNDETTVDELNNALTGINKFLTDLNRLKLDVGGHTEYLTGQQEFKSYLTLKLQPLKNRWYVIQLIDNPRGNVSTRTIEESTSGTTNSNTTTKEVETSDELQISILINQRYFDTVVRGGLMESSFGLGLEQIFGGDDQYSVGLDVWDFGNEFGPHAKLTAYWRFYSNAFFLLGYDDFVSERREFRDAFFGVGVSFNEDSLKPLFSSLPISSVTGQQ